MLFKSNFRKFASYLLNSSSYQSTIFTLLFNTSSLISSMILVTLFFISSLPLNSSFFMMLTISKNAQLFGILTKSDSNFFNRVSILSFSLIFLSSISQLNVFSLSYNSSTSILSSSISLFKDSYFTINSSFFVSKFYVGRVASLGLESIFTVLLVSSSLFEESLFRSDLFQFSSVISGSF